MKKISVCKNQQIIFNHVVPTGAVYGKVTVSFDRHIKTGVKFVTDKNGRQIFNANGTPKMKVLYKEVPTKTTVIYSVESFLSYTFKGEKDRHMYAWVLFEGASKWTEVALCGTPVYKSIETMVRDYIKEHALKEPKIASVKPKNCAGTPKRREANKFDNVFRMRPDYSGTINEEVRPRMPIVHTNMDKCKGDYVQHERYASPYQWEYGATPKKSGNIEIVAAINKNK